MSAKVTPLEGRVRTSLPDIRAYYFPVIDSSSQYISFDVLVKGGVGGSNLLSVRVVKSGNVPLEIVRCTKAFGTHGAVQVRRWGNRTATIWHVGVVKTDSSHDEGRDIK